MKGKHLHIPQDSDLLKSIYRQVDKNLVVGKIAFKITILVKFIFYSMLVGSAYWGLYQIANRIQFTICFIVYGFASLLLAFNFAHDFSHGTILKKPFWDNLGFLLIYTINGAHAEAWKKRHIESHHFAPNVERYDSDLEISSLIRVIPSSKYFWFHKYQHLYAPVVYTTYSLYWVFVKDFFIFWKTIKTRIFGIAYHFSFWVQKIFYFNVLLVFPIIFSPQSWQSVVIAFLLMHMLQSLFLLFTFFMTHHVEGVEYPTTNKEGYINISWVMNQIKCSNDMYPFSDTANFIFGGFNNHIAHHLFPHVHHIYYPKLNRILYDHLNKNGIRPNQTTYWGGICSHLRLLKRMGLKDLASH